MIIKKVIFVLVVIIFFGKPQYAQKGIDIEMAGTVWKIMKVEIERTSGTTDDSLRFQRQYDNFDSVKICFDNKDRMTVCWREFKASGKYKIAKGDIDTQLQFSIKNIRAYEHGNLDKLLYGGFLIGLRSNSKHFINNSNFVMIDKGDGILCKMFFTKVE